MTEAVHTVRDTCRACGGRDVHAFLDLGLQPLANALPADPTEFAEEQRYPLVVHVCRECTLVQLMDVIHPEVLFGHYLYMTGMSSTMDVHNAGYARAMRDAADLTDSSLVVDVASNDGSLLLKFQELGIRTLGIEPAANLAAVAGDRGVPTVCRFFDRDAARGIVAEHGRASAVMANNVLAHVDDPRGFLEGMATLTGPGGWVVIEAPYVGHLLERFEYDTVYHEHLSYFSATALARLFADAGIAIERIDDVAIHGGSVRVWGRPVASTDSQAVHAESVLARIDAERDAGLHDLALYERFAVEVAAHRDRLRKLLADLKRDGAQIAAYGAPAKGNTLLNYCDIGTETLDFVVDRNELKVGRYLPGTHVPVLPVDKVLTRAPDYLLVLPWNLTTEIVASQNVFAERGGRFIVPIPQPQIV